MRTTQDVARWLRGFTFGACFSMIACSQPAPLEASASVVESAEPAPKTVKLDPLVESSPRSTWLLARFAADGDLTAPALDDVVRAWRELCGVDASKVRRQDFTIAEPFQIRIDIVGDIDVDQGQCFLGDYFGKVEPHPEGGVRVIPRNWPKPEGAPRELAELFSATKGKAASFVVARSPSGEVEASMTSSAQGLDGSLRMPASRLDAALKWWARVPADNPARKLIDVRREGEALHLSTRTQAPPIEVATALREHLLEAHKNPSGSMWPTLRIGENLFADRTSRAAERGSVVVFRFPANPEQRFIKRVLAVPGEVLEMVNRRPVIDGRPVPSCRVGTAPLETRELEIFVEFLGGAAYLVAYEGGTVPGPCDSSCTAPNACVAGLCGQVAGPFRVAPTEVWVIGDNRHNSHDSPSWNQGRGAGLPLDHIEGRASFVWLHAPPDRPIDWSRTLLPVHGEPIAPPGGPDLAAGLKRCLESRPHP